MIISFHYLKLMMKIFILRLYIMDLTGSCYDDQHLAKTIFAYGLLHGYNANGYDFNFD